MTRKQLVMMAILAWAAIPAVAQDSEHTYAEWSSETRAALVFKVNAEAVRGVLPTGWSLVSSDDSADQTNLTVIFIDRHLVLDAQGQAVGSGSNRYMVMSVPAHNDVSGENSVLVINGISPEGSGYYEAYQQAVTARASRLREGHAEESGQIQEEWEMVAESGDSVHLSLVYQTQLPVRRQASVVVRSGINPGKTRTYKIDQATDSLGIPGAAGGRVTYIEFEADGPLYSRLFDGSEVLTAVTSTPWYSREIYIP